MGIDIEKGKVREIKEQLKRNRIKTDKDIEYIEKELARKIVEVEVLKKNKKNKIELELAKMELTEVKRKNRELEEFIELLKSKKPSKNIGVLEKIMFFFNIISCGG